MSHDLLRVEGKGRGYASDPEWKYRKSGPRIGELVPFLSAYLDGKVANVQADGGFVWQTLEMKVWLGAFIMFHCLMKEGLSDLSFNTILKEQ